MPKSIICILFNSRCEVERNKKRWWWCRREKRERDKEGGEGEGEGCPLVFLDPALLSGGHPEGILLFSIYIF